MTRARADAPVLFLDVDGVLNTIATRPGTGVRAVELRLPHSGERFTGLVETAKVAALARLLAATGARIVVSSSWRNAFADGAAFATAVGLAPPLAGAPDLMHHDWRTDWKFSSRRHNEIDWWLEEHPRVTRWAALDDHAIWGWGGMDENPREVRTDASVGLTNHELGRVAGLLGRGEHAGRDWFAEAGEQAA